MTAAAAMQERTETRSLRIKATWCPACDVSVSESPCPCRFRRVFRDCLDKRQECSQMQRLGATVMRKESLSLCSRPAEEFIADFDRACRRSCDTRERKVLDAITRGVRIGGRREILDLESKLGEALIVLAPYGLWPPKDYFGRAIRTGQLTRVEKEIARSRAPRTEEDEHWLRSTTRVKAGFTGRSSVRVLTGSKRSPKTSDRVRWILGDAWLNESTTD